MRSFVARISVIVGLLGSLAFLHAGGIAFVNMEDIFQGYYKTGRSDAAFKKQKELFSDHAKDLAAEIDVIKQQRGTMQEKSLNIALSDDVRAKNRAGAEEKNGMYQEKKQELKGFVMKTDKELQKKYLELRSSIVKEISEFLKGYGKEKGYDMVIDASGLTRNFIPVVVYYPESQDITKAVLAELNKGHEDEVTELKKDVAEEEDGKKE